MFFTQTAVVHAGGEFLTDVATFVVIDGVYCVHFGFVHGRFFGDQVAAAVGDGEGDAIVVPVFEWLFF